MSLPDVCDMTEEQRRRLIGDMKIFHARKARQCEHIKTNGEFCGSPALRRRNYCYFHLTAVGRRLRIERAHASMRARAAETFDVAIAPVELELPLLEDANSIQIALMQVIDAVLHNRIDSKRAGLVLYALQTASSNLGNGAHFAQMRGATVAGRYDHFERDFELGEDAPELRVDEAAEDPVDHAKVAQIEEQAAAYAKMDEAEDEADLHRTPTEEDGEEQFRASYPCGFTSQFFCLLNGPLGRTQAGVPEPTELLQRDAASQRIELVSRLRPKGGEDAPPAQEEQETAA